MIAALASSVAWACSCASAPPSLQLPAEAYIGGPVRLFLRQRWQDADVDRLVEDLRLRDPGGAPVPFRAEALGWRLDLVPIAPMAPGRHTVERRVSATWYTVGEFGVVGHVAALSPPSVTWKRWHISDDCGPASSIRAVGAAAPGAEWLEVEVEDIGLVGTFAIRDKSYAYVSDDDCVKWKVTLPADQALRVRAVAVGLDGSRAPGPWTRLSAVGPAHPPVGSPPVPRPIAAPATPPDRQADQCWDEPVPRSR